MNPADSAASRVNNRPESLRRKTLRTSVFEGGAFSVMAGVAENAFPPFAVFCEFTARQIGILLTLPLAVGNSFQLLIASRLGTHPARRKVIGTGAFLQALSLLCLALLAVYVRPASYYAVLAALMLFYGSGQLIGPIWNGMMGDIVPRQLRGRYFAHRSRVCALNTLCAILAAGVILSAARHRDLLAWGFAALFFLGFAARAVSSRLLSKMHDPLIAHPPHAAAPGLAVLKDGEHRRPYWTFVLFLALMQFSIHLAGPYFAVHMLADLHFTYLEFTAATTVIFVSQIATMIGWGRLADRIGNRMMLAVCGVGLSIVPWLWLVSGSFVWILAVQLYAGVVWAGFLLACANYLYECLPSRAAAVGFSVSNFLNGICVFLGGWAGGAAAEWTAIHLPALVNGVLGGFSLHTVFLISGCSRLCVYLFFIRRMPEMRLTRHPASIYALFRVSRIRPIAGIAFDLIAGYWRPKRQS